MTGRAYSWAGAEQNRQPCGKPGLLGRMVGVLFAAPYLFLSGSLGAESLQKPHLELKETVLDFGRALEGAVVKSGFTIKNSGSAELTIDRVVPSCGCSSVTPNTTSIKPGDQTVFGVVFDTTGMQGRKEGGFRIFSNDPDRRAATLLMSVEVMPSFSVEPKVVSFGSIYKGELDRIAEQRVSVAIAKESGAVIDSFHTFSKFIEFKVLEQREREAVLWVKLKSNLAVGELRDRIAVKLNGGQRNVLNIPIHALIKDDLALDAASISFGVVEGEKPVTKLVKLLVRPGLDVRFIGVSSNHAALTGSVTAAADAVVVQLDPSKFEGELKAVLEFKTNAAERPKMAINVKASLPPVVR